MEENNDWAMLELRQLQHQTNTVYTSYICNDQLLIQMGSKYLDSEISTKGNF